MQRHTIRAVGAIAASLLLCLSVTGVGFSEWTTEMGAVGGSVSIALQTKEDVAIIEAEMILAEGAYRADEESVTEAEDDAGEAAEAETETGEAESEESADDVTETEEADSDAEETKEADGEETEEAETDYDEAAKDDDPVDAEDAEEAEDEADDGTDEDAGAEVISGEQVILKAAEGGEDAGTTVSVIDDMEGLTPVFPGVVLPDSDATVTYRIVVENQGSVQAVLWSVDFEAEGTDITIEEPAFDENTILEPGESLELVWIVSLGSEGGETTVYFSAEVKAGLPTPGEAAEAGYCVRKAGEEEE